MELCHIHESDFADVLALNAASVPHVNLIDEQQLTWFVENADYVRVVRLKGRLAGFLIGLGAGSAYESPNYQWFSARYDNFIYVDRIAVADWAQRRGIAAALYADFATEMPSSAIITCEVNLRPRNEGSLKFHLNSGFRQVGSQETEGGSKEVALMEKTL